MIKKELLIKTLKLYCDSVWEYDAETGKIFVHHDTLAAEWVERLTDPDELTDFFCGGSLLEMDKHIWQRRLSREGLTHFLNSDEEECRFFLRFKAEKSDFEWHRVIIERQSEHSLVISSKNIYNEIRERSLMKTLNKTFDNIMYIDVESGSYILHNATKYDIPDEGANNYSDMLDNFKKLNIVGIEEEDLSHNMRLENVIEKLKNADEYILYATVRGAGGDYSYKKLVFSYLDNYENIITLVRIDISDIVGEYEQQIRQFRKETYRDALTGVHNRKYYEEKIKRISRRAGVAIIDIDDFKLCNDTYGHGSGDAALIRVAEIAGEVIGTADMLVRYGGDEFLLVMPNVGEHEFENKLTQIQKRVSETSLEKYPQLKLSVSVGGVMAENDMMETAVEKADQLMYQAKTQKNMVVTENGGMRDDDRSGVLYDCENLKQMVMIVDDSEMNRAILTEMLKGDFRILEAKNGEECLELLQQYGTGISLVLLDIVMPVMDGFEVLAAMNSRHIIEDIPVIMISGEDSDSSIRRAYGLGVSDYISRPFDAKVVYRRVFNTIKLYSKQRSLISIVTRQAYDKEKNNRMMIDILSQIVEFRNGESGLHVLHIKALTGLIIERLIQKSDKYRLSWYDRELITTASALHDVGKIAISSEILNKPGKLTDEEFEEMKKHTVLGASMLTSLELYRSEDLVKTAAEICRSHHERFDGRGYPDGLRGDEIPISAQIVSVADVYDALVSDRVYKKAFSHEKAIQMILNGECGTFNPLIVECLVDVQDRIADELAASINK